MRDFAGAAEPRAEDGAKLAAKVRSEPTPMLYAPESLPQDFTQPPREILEPLDGPAHPHAKLLLDNWRMRELDFTIGRDIPARPLGSVLRYLAILDPMAEPEFRVRLAGTAWLRRYGRDVTGLLLSDLYMDDELLVWQELLRETVLGGGPISRDATLIGEGGLQLHFEILALPALASNGHDPCVMAGLFYHDWLR
jgi:hypothetical protein